VLGPKPSMQDVVLGPSFYSQASDPGIMSLAGKAAGRFTMRVRHHTAPGIWTTSDDDTGEICSKHQKN
jgi:hypothetical protein